MAACKSDPGNISKSSAVAGARGGTSSDRGLLISAAEALPAAGDKRRWGARCSVYVCTGEFDSTVSLFKRRRSKALVFGRSADG